MQVILAGYLLNLIVFPEDPIWQLGVLQTIGFSILALIPALWVIRYAWGRALIVAVSVALYVAFGLAYVPLEQWLGAHRLVAQVAFADFPPWPWTTLVLVSAVLGWRFCEANQEGEAARARYFRAMAVAGVLCLLAFVAYDVWMHTPVRFGFMRDFIVNHHWTPARRDALLGRRRALLHDARRLVPDGPSGMGAALAGGAGTDGDDALLHPPDHRLHHREEVAGRGLPFVVGLLGGERRPHGRPPLHRQGLAVDAAAPPPPAIADARAATARSLTATGARLRRRKSVAGTASWPARRR